VWACAKNGKYVAATGFELEFDTPVLQHSTHRRGGREERQKGWGEEEDQGAVADAHQGAVAADAEDAALSPILVRGAGGQSLQRGAGGQRAGGQREEAAGPASWCCLPIECVDQVHARVPSMPGAPSDRETRRTWRQGNQKIECVAEDADAPERALTRPVGRDKGKRLSRAAAGGGEGEERAERGGGSTADGTRATAQVSCKNGEKGKDRGKMGIEDVGGVDALKRNRGETHLAVVASGRPGAPGSRGQRLPPAVMNRSGVPSLAANEGATIEGPRRGVVAAPAGVFEGFTFMLCEGAGMDVLATGAPSAASVVGVVVSATGLAATGTRIGEGGAGSHGNGRGGGAGSSGNGIPGLCEVIERAGGRVVRTGRGLLDGWAPCPKCNRCPPVDYEVYPVWPLPRPSEQGREREHAGEPLDQGTGAPLDQETPRAAGESLPPLAAACQRCKALEARGTAAGGKARGGATGTVQVSEFWVRKCAALGERVGVASQQLHLPNSLSSLPPQQSAELRSMRGAHVCLSGVHGHEKRFYKWFITQVLPVLSLCLSSASYTRRLIFRFRYPGRVGARPFAITLHSWYTV
jgi:hypothetical protein